MCELTLEQAGLDSNGESIKPKTPRVEYTGSALRRLQAPRKVYVFFHRNWPSLCLDLGSAFERLGQESRKCGEAIERCFSALNTHEPKRYNPAQSLSQDRWSK